MSNPISGCGLPVHGRPDPVGQAAQGLRGRGRPGSLQRSDPRRNPETFVRKNRKYRETFSSRFP